MADACLPEDLLISILKRLSPETLIACLIVCKSWNSLITSPNFISAYHRHHPNPKPLLLHFEQSKLLSSFSPYSCSFHGLPSHSTFDAFIGSSNGVVCLFNHAGRTVCLWNPTIRKHLNLDPVPSQNPHLSLGFGFDPSSNDFKVVAVSFFSSLVPSTSPRLPPQTHVFSLNSGTWRTVGLCAGSWGHLSCISWSIFVDGVVYWVASFGYMFGIDDENSVEYEYAASILTFDLRSESFGELGFPPGVGNGNGRKPNVFLATIDDSLALVHNEMWEYRLWVMKENVVEASWSLCHRISLPIQHLREYVDEDSIIWVEKHSDNEAYIITCSGTLIVVDRESPPSSFVDAKDWPGRHVFSYVESLALLEKFSWLQRENHTFG